MGEKESVQEIAGKLVITVLWEPSVNEAEADTAQHHLRAWKEQGRTLLEVKKIR